MLNIFLYSVCYVRILWIENILHKSRVGYHISATGQAGDFFTASEIFIEKQFHAANGPDSLCSLAAAKAKTIRISSRRRLGKSARISCSVIPPAKYSRMSYTVMRVPLRQGLPSRISGVMVIWFSKFMSMFLSRHLTHRHMLHQIFYRWSHHLQQRRRPQAEEQNGDGQ